MGKKSVWTKKAWEGLDGPSEHHNELDTTVDQWREALAATTKPKYPEGLTLTELATKLGINKYTLRYQLDKAVEADRCFAHQDYRKNRLTTVYILMEEP